jgi:hypothetical protein
MDLNQLYFDHQVLAMRADTAPTPRARQERRFDAALVAARIGCKQRAIGAPAARSWEALAR